MSTLRWMGWLWVIGVTSVACHRTPALHPDEPTLSGQTGMGATCSVAKDPLNPLIVEWPGTNRTELESVTQQGPAVVSYVGCVMKVLPACQASGAGSYEMVSTSPTREKLDIADESELKARLPLGVGSLRGELKQNTALQLDYVSVGQKVLKKAPVTLTGQCEGATHYVRSITVGAYSLNTVATSSAGAGAGVGQADVGIDVKKNLGRVRGSGDVESCARGAKDGCLAPLQLGLAPITTAGGKVASAGFGAGLGAITVVPELGQLRELPSGSGGLADADVALLKLLQTAKRTDRSTEPALKKARAWEALASAPGKNPYREAAEQRRDQWNAVDEAERRLAEQVSKMCDRYLVDGAKLKELQALDDDVVSKSQKQAYAREYEQVYSSWKSYLPKCSSLASSREPMPPAPSSTRGMATVATGSPAPAPPAPPPLATAAAQPASSDLTGITIRLIYPPRRAADARRAAARLQAHGAKTDLVEVTDSGNDGFVGKAFVMTKYTSQFAIVAAALKDIEPLSGTFGDTYAFNDGQQMNVWIAK